MRSSYKTIALWIGLILLFVAFYQYFGATQPHWARNAREPEPVWVTAVPVGAMVVVFGVLFVVFRRTAKRNALSVEAVGLMNQGRYSEALAKFEEFRRQSPKHPLSPYNVGVANLALWRVEEAAKDFDAADALAKQQPYLKEAIPPFAAVASALLGKPELAKQWLSRLDPKKGDRPLALLAEGLLACRAGDDAGARATLTRFEVKQLGGFHAALAIAVSAFCLERQSGELKPVDKVALFGETGPERLKALWPELAEFVAKAPAA